MFRWSDANPPRGMFNDEYSPLALAGWTILIRENIVGQEQSTITMRNQLEPAKTSDAAALASLQVATSDKLTEHFGPGPWSRNVTERGMLLNVRNASVYVLRRRNKVIATLTLCTKKPWAIDRKYFSKSDRPLYLTSMAVAPDRQRQGIGKLCIDAAVKIVKQWPGDAIRLDAYDAEAGAGEFYGKCGFREVGRASYRNTPLIYFEMLI